MELTNATHTAITSKAYKLQSVDALCGHQHLGTKFKKIKFVK